MTAPTDQFADIAGRSQEAVTTAVRTWADTLQNVVSTMASGQSQLPDLQSVVGQYFDFAEQVLASQRELAQQWAAGAAKASEAVTEQAQDATRSAAEQTVNGTEAAVDTASRIPHAVAEDTPPA